MEELTTKMHSEFNISNDLEIKHRCFNALEDHIIYSDSIETVTVRYNVTEKQMNIYRKEFEASLSTI